MSTVPVGLCDREAADSHDLRFTPNSSHLRPKAGGTDSSSRSTIYDFLTSSVFWKPFSSCDQEERHLSKVPLTPLCGFVLPKLIKVSPFVLNCSINQLHKACWMEADKSQGFRELKGKKKPDRICVLIQWLSYPLKHVSIVLSIVTLFSAYSLHRSNH